MTEIDPDTVAMLARIAEDFAAQGEWANAISTARWVQDIYEQLARSDRRFAAALDEARDRVQRFVSQARTHGAPTALEPSPLAKAIVLAVDLDRLTAIPGRKLRRADPSVRAAAERARRTPIDSATAVAEKLARHAVLLWRFDRRALAHDAALAAATLYETMDRDSLEPRDEGFCAYCLLILAIGWHQGGEIDAAYSLADQTVELFQRHYRLLTPQNMFDLSQALGLLALCQLERGERDKAGQSIVDAVAIADAMERQVPGVPGAIPEVPWGLPVVPSDKDRKALYGSGASGKRSSSGSTD